VGRAHPEVLGAKNRALALSMGCRRDRHLRRPASPVLPEMLLDELEVQVDAVPQPSPTPVPAAAPGAAGPGA
jgi:hypothetical protein